MPPTLWAEWASVALKEWGNEHADQSCGRFEKQQQGGWTPAGRVGGDTLHCRWRLLLSLIALGGHGYSPGLAVKASREAATVRWHMGTLCFKIFPSTLNHITAMPADVKPAIKVLIPCLMSDWTLIRSRHHHSLSPPSIIDADPFFSLPLSISLSMPDSRSS